MKSMLVPGRIELTPAEHDAVEDLLAEHREAAVSLTRRDPGESGPVLVHVDDHTWEISQDGKRKKVA